MCHYASNKRCADFILKMHQKHLAAGLRLDLLRQLTALPKTLCTPCPGKKESGVFQA